MSANESSKMAAPSDVKRLDYANKIMLAPMVRIGTLPARLLALEYGADIVYCEEIIDYKILAAKRMENEVLGTVDYVLSDDTIVFRTHPREKDRLVFQLGTSDATRALRAAQKVEKDVAGIDVNMGCPKEFSIKGGMGAALLTQPDNVKEILTTLVNGLSIPVTCKMRLLPQLENTLSLVQLMQSTGVSAIAVHGRTKEERPRHANRVDVIQQIAETVSVPIIANGGSKEIHGYEDIEKFRREAGASSVMMARAAEWNPSIFRQDGKLPLYDVIIQYLKICLDYDNGFTNTKYNILQMMHDDMGWKEGLPTQESKCIEEICDIWGMRDYMKEVYDRRRKSQETVVHTGIKRRKHDDGKVLIEMPVRFIKKDYPVSVSPKLKLFEWTVKHKVEKPRYVTTERPVDRCYKCVMELLDRHYTITAWEKSKQLAEQGAVIAALTVLGEHDGRKPGAISPNDAVARQWREEFEMNDKFIYRHKTDPVIAKSFGASETEPLGITDSEPKPTKNDCAGHKNEDVDVKKDSESNPANSDCSGDKNKVVCEKDTESAFVHVTAATESNTSVIYR